MAQRRSYTKSEKAKAVGLAVISTTEGAAKQLGIPRRTLGQWIERPEYAALRHKSREAVAEEMWTAIQVGLEEVAKGLKGEAPLRDKATALGILWDKHALMTGSATSRTENRELNDLPDSAYVEAIREFERIRAAPEAEAEPAG